MGMSARRIMTCLAMAALLSNGPAVSAGNHGPANSLSQSTNSAAISQRWDSILIGNWYVPVANLLAYIVLKPGVSEQAISDQTLFQITSAQNGVFTGKAYVQFSPSDTAKQINAPLQYTMSGIVTPQGQIRIQFTPSNQDQAPTIGIGNMEFVDGAWRMTMQMASGPVPYVIHWAYQTRDGEPPISASTAAQFGRYGWLQGTSWAITDSQVFSSTSTAAQASSKSLNRGEFQISGYDSGYFWGLGGGSTSFAMVGSVTPQGKLFFVLTSGGTNYTRTGTLQPNNGRWTMRFRSYEGSAAEGVAVLLRK